MANKIELSIYDKDGTEELKTFHQPSKIKGSALRVGLKLESKMQKMADSENADIDEMIDEMYQYVAEYGYNNQFTASEYEDGLDARDILQITTEQISSIISRGQDKTGKPTKVKKA